MLELIARFCCGVGTTRPLPPTVDSIHRNQRPSQEMCGPEVFIERRSAYRSENFKHKPSPRPRASPTPKHQLPRANVPTNPPLRPLSVDSSTTAAQSPDDEYLLDAKIVTCEPKWSIIEGSPRSVKSVDRAKREPGPKERHDVWMAGFEAGRRDQERKKEQVRKWKEEKRGADDGRKKIERFKEEERSHAALADAEKRRHEEELARMKKRQREQELAQAVEAQKLTSALEVEAKKQDEQRKLEADGAGQKDRLIRPRDPTDRRTFRQRIDGALGEERTTLRQKSRRSRRSDSVSSVSSHSVEEIVRRVRRAMSILSFSERERERWSKRRQRSKRA